MRRSCVPIQLFSLLLLVLLKQGAWGQAGPIDSEFAGAGARPLSMGGAFIGLADDSTAAEFNPAGIRILPRPELAWQVTRTYDSRDTYYLLSETRDSDHNIWNTPSFISFVYPTQEYTWAVSQLTTIDFVHAVHDQNEKGTWISRTEATNNAFGFTYAKDLKPRLHFGITVRMNRFQYESMSTLDGQLLFGNTLTDWSPSVNLGILWRATEDWSFGSVYKSHQKIETTGGKTYLPETLGIGVAYHPNDKIRVLADVDYISWSDFNNIREYFRRNDVMRYHLGGEYLLKVEKGRAFFVRGGVMREDSNAIYYVKQNPDLQRAFPKEPAKNHLSVGLGMATDEYQIDWAVDHTIDGGTVLILSMVHYF